MLPSKTVFVVGAGASSEVGLPIGSALRSAIATKVDLRFDHGHSIGSGDLRIYEALKRKDLPRINDYVEACWRIRDGVILSGSIDDYLDAHSDDPLATMAGKLAIAASLLDAEAQSKLHFTRDRLDTTINFRGIQDTWYVRLYQLLTQQVARTKLTTLFDNVTVVTFNYDRCIEHFLVHAIAANYHIGRDEAATLVQRLPIYRPYGTVGEYFGPDAVPFGSTKLPEPDTISKQLRTYTERVEDETSLNAIRAAIDTAGVIVFLGFAFHANNMRLLGDLFTENKVKRIFATRYDVSDSDMEVVMKRITNGRSHLFNFQIAPSTLKCVHLFERYHLSLRQ